MAQKIFLFKKVSIITVWIHQIRGPPVSNRQFYILFALQTWKTSFPATETDLGKRTAEA